MAMGARAGDWALIGREGLRTPPGWAVLQELGSIVAVVGRPVLADLHVGVNHRGDAQSRHPGQRGIGLVRSEGRQITKGHDVNLLEERWLVLHRDHHDALDGSAVASHYPRGVAFEGAKLIGCFLPNGEGHYQSHGDKNAPASRSTPANTSVAAGATLA